MACPESLAWNAIKKIKANYFREAIFYACADLMYGNEILQGNAAIIFANDKFKYLNVIYSMLKFASIILRRHECLSKNLMDGIYIGWIITFWRISLFITSMLYNVSYMDLSIMVRSRV